MTTGLEKFITKYVNLSDVEMENITGKFKIREVKKNKLFIETGRYL